MLGEARQGMDNKGQIRELIESWISSVRAKDVEGSAAPYAADVVAYDLINPLQYTGTETIKKRLTEWFSSFEGPIEIELRDLDITAGDDVAFCHGLHRVNGTKTDGTKLDMWWRTTLCLSKIDEKWTITHSHDSVPFNMENGMASLDLKH
jgi:uncharacterized protein (TIGR02246 family)